MRGTDEFFVSVLPAGGTFVLAWKNKTSGWKHKTFNDIDAACKTSDELANSGFDVYFCIGTILDPKFKNDKGKVSPRAQENIFKIKSLVLDLDVDESSPKKFHSQEEALVSLANFQETFQLPTPTVVSSGYGIHVYFPLEEALNPAEWLKLANLFKSVVGHFDKRLIADPTRVCDYAGLLRVPNTFNFKKEIPAETSVLSLAEETLSESRILDSFKEYIVQNELSEAKDVKPFARPKVKLSLDEPHDFVSVTKKCNWLKQYIKNKNKASEPEWYAVAGVVKHLQAKHTPPLEIFHMLSEGHPGYSKEETEKKWNQVQDRQSGPTLCARLGDLQPAWCLGCPFAGMVTTPVHLDRVDLPAAAPVIEREIVKDTGEITVQKVPIPMPPAPYHRGKEGKGIYMTVVEEGANGDEESVVKQIYEYDIFPVRRLKDEESDDEMLEISLTLPVDGHRFIKLSNGLLVDPKKLTEALAKKGVLVHPKQGAHLTAYLIEYAKKIQREERADEEFARLGWRGIDTHDPRFVFGRLVIDKKGSMKEASLASYLDVVKDVISVKGNIEEWKKGFNVYQNIEGSEPLQYALMMAFAAPLVALTPFHGMIYNMLGNSGCGKSTALKLMTSVWGKPNEHHIQVQDNRIPMLNKIGYIQSVPVAFDELTVIAADTLADIAYAITEGRGKERADRQGNTRTNTVQWKTIVVGTSNSSLYEKLGMSRSGNNAHAYRIFEVNVHNASDQYRTAVDKALIEVSNNFGVAGKLFITHVLKNLPDVTKKLSDATIRFAAEYSRGTAERFYFASFACMWVGGMIARELGLHNYDVDRLIAWAANQLIRVRETVRHVEGDPVSVLAHFIQQNLRSILVVRDGRANTLSMESAMASLLMRFEHEGGKAMRGYISVPAIKDYCLSQKVEYGWLLRNLEDKQVVRGVVSKRLGDGTPLPAATTRCWEIDLQHPVMQGEEPITSTPVEVAQAAKEKRLH